MSNVLQQANWKTIKESKVKIALLPWGATEAHNYHLPYGTDTILAEKLAEMSSNLANEKGAKSIVLPSIAYGVNSGQLDIPFCMNLHPSTQKMILRDILQVLTIHGVNKVIIINAHGGNQFQPIIRELSVEFPNIMVCNINWWVVCKGSDYFVEPGDHAGELETSSMLAVAPELVLPLEEAGDGEERRLKLKGFSEKWAWIPRRWVLTSADTGVGNPKLATAEKGDRFINDCAAKIAEFISEFEKAESESDLYETK